MSYVQERMGLMQKCVTYRTICVLFKILNYTFFANFFFLLIKNNLKIEVSLTSVQAFGDGCGVDEVSLAQYTCDKAINLGKEDFFVAFHIRFE